MDAKAVVLQELRSGRNSDKLADALSLLTSLSLDRNNIGDAGAAALSEALKSNATLMTLFLNDNQIGDAGAAALSEALEINATLTTLASATHKSRSLDGKGLASQCGGR